MVLRYSSCVVAPITVNSPRDKAGLIMSAKPLEPLSPPVEPAPKIWWISSKKRMILPASLTSLTKFWIFSSKAPRYCVPASNPEISIEITSLFLILAGTSPLTIACAKPSTTAVLPTPASPTRTGLFLVRRAKISAVSWISLFRPITGSRLPCLASSVKLLPSLVKILSSFGVLAAAWACCISGLPGSLPVCLYCANSSGLTSRPLIKYRRFSELYPPILPINWLKISSIFPKGSRPLKFAIIYYLFFNYYK